MRLISPLLVFFALMASIGLVHGQAAAPFGDWSPGTEYDKLDLVRYGQGNDWYQAIKESTGVTPGTDSSTWTLLEDTNPLLNAQPGDGASATFTAAPIGGEPSLTGLPSTDDIGSPPSSTSSSSPVKLINISTNGYALTGNEKMSAGFIVSGTENLKVYIKAEKSQEPGITPLSDPKMEIWNIARTQKLTENDNWVESSDVAAIQALGGSYPPTEVTDSAVILTLAPGAYLADIYGAKGNTGKVLVAVNNIDSSSSSELINISTNGYAYTGSEKMSAGFIISGTGNQKVYIKAEKSQEPGITPLSDPKMEIWNIARTTKLTENDNWVDSSDVAAIQALGGGYPPIEVTDSAVMLTLAPGAYLVDVYGAKGNSGKVLVAINKIN